MFEFLIHIQSHFQPVVIQHFCWTVAKQFYWWIDDWKAIIPSPLNHFTISSTLKKSKVSAFDALQARLKNKWIFDDDFWYLRWLSKTRALIASSVFANSMIPLDVFIFESFGGKTYDNKIKIFSQNSTFIWTMFKFSLSQISWMSFSANSIGAL